VYILLKEYAYFWNFFVLLIVTVHRRKIMKYVANSGDLYCLIVMISVC
jgi:hypothetical protein